MRLEVGVITPSSELAARWGHDGGPREAERQRRCERTDLPSPGLDSNQGPADYESAALDH
jgi:hypothetical protein